MPSRFISQPVVVLNKGAELRGLVDGLTMAGGSATDVLDILPREDGAVFKHHGWIRTNSTALTGRPLGVKSFTYRGKNADAGGGETARPGNYGLADDGADYTKRSALYSGCIVLTDSTFYRWDAASETFVSVSLPGGVTVDQASKPSFIVYNDNVYIAGWADSNLRYDPCDEVLYLWGWEDLTGTQENPPAPTLAAGAAGDLIKGAVYKYAYTYVDIYTGEESALGDVDELTATATGQINVTVAAYAGSRHFNTLATDQDTDVGVVVYRTEADDEQFNFLDILLPSDFAAGSATLNDTGLATDASIQPYKLAEGINQTEINGPRFNFISEFKDQFYGVSYEFGRADKKLPADLNVVRWNVFDAENSFVERWRPLDYRPLPLPDGEILTALHADDTSLLVFTQKGAYVLSVTPNYASGLINRSHNRLPWTVGCVGPRAVCAANGWLYFLSERGPYRWRTGMMEPEWIGRPTAPMFIDGLSGLCQLSPGLRAETQVIYDQSANMVRWIFACGSTNSLNRHLMYWVEADKFSEDSALGWFFASPRAQCMDVGMALAGANPDGSPPSAITRQDRLIFGDDDGYINTYEVGHQRAGLPDGSIASGTATAGTATTITCTTAANPLHTDGDSLKGMRLEVVHSDGTIEVRKIRSNTTTVITVVEPFQTTPASGDTWYVAGIPAFWRSWVEDGGLPHDRKSMLHLYLSFSLTDPTGGALLDVTVLSGDRDMSNTRARTAALNDYNEKILVSRTALFFAFEVANTRPDEMFTLTAVEPEFAVHGHKRRE